MDILLIQNEPVCFDIYQNAIIKNNLQIPIDVIIQKNAHNYGQQNKKLIDIKIVLINSWNLSYKLCS